MSQVLHLTSANWKEEVQSSPVPVLVDFWAEWCMPCRALTPVLEDLAKETDGKLKIGKVNVDECRDLATQFGIRAIPTMFLMKNGSVQMQISGSMNKASLLSKLSGQF